MGVLAANMVDAEGQAGITVITQAASKTQTNANFATELEGRLAYDSGPTDPGQIIVPEGASETEKLLKDGEPRHETAVPSTVSPDVTLPSGSIPATTTPKGDARSSATLNQTSAFHLTLTLPALPLEQRLQAPSTKGVAPEKTSSIFSSSLPAQEPATQQEQPESAANPKSGSTNYEARGDSGSSVHPSRPTQDYAVTQQRPVVTKTNPEPPGGASSTYSSRLSRSTKPVELGKPAQRLGVTAQIGPPQSFVGATCLFLASQSKSSKEIAISSATLAVTASPVQPPGLTPTSAFKQHTSVDVPAPAADQFYPTHGANLSQSSGGTQGATIAAHAPSQNAMRELGPLAPSSYATTAGASSKRSNGFPPDNNSPGWSDALDAPSGSRLSNGQQSVLAEAASSSPGVTPPSQSHALASGMNPLGTNGSSRPNDTSSNLAGKTATSLRGPTTESELQNVSSLDYPKSAAPLENGSIASTTNQGAPIDANPATDPFKTTGSFTSKQAEAGSAGGLNLSRDPSATLIASRSSGSSPDDGTRTAGAEPPTRQAATQPEALSSSASPQSTVPQQVASNGGSAPSADNPGAPSDDEPMVLLDVPDYSFAPPSGLTKALSPLDGDDPASPGRTKNPQDVSNAAPGPSSGASPIRMADTHAPASAQSQDTQSAASVPDKRQSEASGHKNDAGTTPDLAKAAGANLGLSKTSADSANLPQFGSQAPTQTGRAAFQGEGAPQGRAEPAGTSLTTGYQPTVQGAVSSARLTQQAGSAEMQVRLRTETLGQIDVHTVLKGGDIGASIRVEARDTQAMMANEISHLEQALNERSLRVQRLDVLQGSVSGNQSGGTGPGNYHGNPSQPRPGSASHSVVETYPALPETLPVYDDGAPGSSTARINLRV